MIRCVRIWTGEDQNSHFEEGSIELTPGTHGDLLSGKLRGPDNKVRREYVHLLVDQVEVGDREIRITGRNAALERAVIASQTPTAPVPKAERKWCTRQDSNL